MPDEFDLKMGTKLYSNLNGNYYPSCLPSHTHVILTQWLSDFDVGPRKSGSVLLMHTFWFGEIGRVQACAILIGSSTESDAGGT